MPPRAVVESGLRAKPLQPVASPVADFHPTNGGAQLAQLADALTTFAPEVMGLGILLQKKKNEKDYLAGQQLTREHLDSAASYKEAIGKGLIPPEASPWFRKGAEEQFGKMAADRFRSDAALAFAQSDSADSYKAEDFDHFMQHYMETWSGDHLPAGRSADFNIGFQKVDDYIAGMRDQFAERAGENLVKYNRDTFGAAQFAGLRRYTEDGRSMTDMASQLQTTLDTQIASGLSPVVANNITAEAVVRMATLTSNPAYLDLLKSVKAGAQSLFDRPAVQAMVQQAEGSIYERRAQADAEKRRRETEANETATSGVFSAAITKIQSDTSANLDPFIDQLKTLKAPYSTVESLINLRRSYAAAKFDGDQGITNTLLANVTTITDPHDSNYVSEVTAANALNARRINQTDFNNVMSYIQRRSSEDNGAGTKVLRDPNFEQYRSLLKAQFGNELTMPAEKALGMFRAVSEMTAEWVQWRTGEGATSTTEAQLKKLNDIVEIKRKRFGGQFQDIKDTFTAGLPQAQIGTVKPGQEPWRTAPAKNITPVDWTSIAAAYARGNNSVDSLSNDQIQKLINAGATPETLSEFLKAQLPLNGINPPAAAPR